MEKNYIIVRPRLHPNFQLPSRKELLKLRPGDSVKLMFRVGTDDTERMWVLLTDTSGDDLWKGIIDNDAMQQLTAQTLPADKAICFHPLDIIATY